MKNINPKTPTQANYRILNLIEQIAATAPQGTALGLCDVMSAMFSGYFIESGGAVTPAIEAFLRWEINEAKEREARTRRAAKSITYGSYNLSELMSELRHIVESEGNWEPMKAQGYRIIAVDFTPYRRLAVKKLKAKAYVSDTNRAVSAVPIGMIASVGAVKGQRIALLKNATIADLRVNDEAAHKNKLYKQVAKALEKDEIAVFDAGFGLVGAVEAGVTHCLIRLAKNCTFGKTPGKIPERTDMPLFRHGGIGQSEVLLRQVFWLALLDSLENYGETAVHEQCVRRPNPLPQFVLNGGTAVLIVNRERLIVNG